MAAAWEVAAATGLAGITLREIAVRVGMRPPSLYSHFDSKLAIYDAMYGDAWRTYEARDVADEHRRTGPAREQLRRVAVHFFDFAVEVPTRYELMNQRTVPGFTPSPDSYEPAVRVLRRMTDLLTRLGVRDPAGTDLWVALVGGLVDAQLANDPGGTRWRRLLDRTVDMYADHMGLPPAPAQKGSRP
ncbi:MAG: TetR/AcrR family transcriptional regulator [Actinomycetota bacterium]|nr:TetR/AcrR family transcriptional regulator [Actinomycetota bacterium]